MITGLTHIHSSFRYLVLIFLLLAVVDAFAGIGGGKGYKKSSKLFALGSLILVHIQLLIGLSLYFLGAKGFNALMNADGVMKDPTIRFFAVEHALMMVIAIVLITIGYSKAKKKEDTGKKQKTIALYYGLALVIILAMIPWPFMKDFGTWV